jgi:hypothetical protein
MTVRLYYNAADARARASNDWHAEWISKSGLKARLWTDKAISEFLGAPLDAGPVKAWKQREVKRSKRLLRSKPGWNNVAHG